MRELLAILSGESSALRFMFDSIDVAEQALAESGMSLELQPFRSLYPTPVLRAVASKKLYRAHVGELIQRAKLGVSLRTATDAEIIAVISVGSMSVPPRAAYISLAIDLYSRLFPGELELSDYKPAYAYPEERWEIVHTIRKTLEREIGNR